MLPSTKNKPPFLANLNKNFRIFQVSDSRNKSIFSNSRAAKNWRTLRTFRLPSTTRTKNPPFPFLPSRQNKQPTTMAIILIIKTTTTIAIVITVIVLLLIVPMVITARVAETCQTPTDVMVCKPTTMTHTFQGRDWKISIAT